MMKKKEKKETDGLNPEHCRLTVVETMGIFTSAAKALPPKGNEEYQCLPRPTSSFKQICPSKQNQLFLQNARDQKRKTDSIGLDEQGKWHAGSAIFNPSLCLPHEQTDTLYFGWTQKVVEREHSELCNAPYPLHR